VHVIVLVVNVNNFNPANAMTYARANFAYRSKWLEVVIATFFVNGDTVEVILDGMPANPCEFAKVGDTIAKMTARALEGLRANLPPAFQIFLATDQGTELGAVPRMFPDIFQFSCPPHTFKKAIRNLRDVTAMTAPARNENEEPINFELPTTLHGVIGAEGTLHASQRTVVSTLNDFCNANRADLNVTALFFKQ
jgi:hypothetical protein